MANWTINSKTAKTAWTDTDSLVIQDSGNTVKKLALSVLRKIIPATDSASAFQVMKADGTKPVLTVDTSNSRVTINQGIISSMAPLDVTGAGIFARRYASAPTVFIARINGSEGAPTQVTGGTAIGQVFFGGYGATTTLVGTANIKALSDEAFTDSTGATSLSLQTTPTGSITASESVNISGAGAVKFPRIATTASAANAYLDSGASNNLLRSTSSAKYKTDIKDLVDSSVLDDLRPIVYKSNPETVPNDDPTKEHYGFIAEELDKVDSKLVHYIKDEDGKEIPDGAQYERVVVLLVKRIHELEARLAKAGI